MRARRVAWWAGYDLYLHRGLGRVRVGRVERLGPLDDGRRAVPTSFEVEVARMTSFLGFSFAPSGWNPLVQTILEYEANPELTYRESTLAAADERFVPADLAHLFLGAEEAGADDCLGTMPVDRRLYRYPWTVSPADVSAARQAGRRSTSYYFGPKGPEEGEREFRRLIDAFCSIRDQGYRPDAYGAITGHLIGDSHDHRFVVGSGNHRAAALAALGVERARVRLESHPAVITRSQLHRWTIDHGGPYSVDSAQHLFACQSADDGTTRAREHGLLPRGHLPSTHHHHPGR